MSHLSQVLLDILDERKRQDARWGQSNHPDFSAYSQGENLKHTCQIIGISTPEEQKAWVNKRATEGNLGWFDLVLKKLCEILEKSDPVERRKELVQLAAVVVAWIEAVDRKPK